MRKAWSRHPIKIEFKKQLVVMAPMGKLIDKATGKPRMVKCFECATCGKLYRDADIQVDHINPAGTFRDWKHCEQWLMGLMQINFTHLQLLCKGCHDIKSYADQYGYSLEEAEARKCYISWKAETTVVEQKELLGVMGAKQEELRNEDSRKAAFLRLYAEYHQ